MVGLEAASASHLDRTIANKMCITLAILTCPGCGRGGLRVPEGRRGKVTCPRCGAVPAAVFEAGRDDVLFGVWFGPSRNPDLVRFVLNRDTRQLPPKFQFFACLHHPESTAIRQSALTGMMKGPNKQQ